LGQLYYNDRYSQQLTHETEQCRKAEIKRNSEDHDWEAQTAQSLPNDVCNQS